MSDNSKVHNSTTKSKESREVFKIKICTTIQDYLQKTTKKDQIALDIFSLLHAANMKSSETELGVYLNIIYDLIEQQEFTEVNNDSQRKAIKTECEKLNLLILSALSKCNPSNDQSEIENELSGRKSKRIKRHVKDKNKDHIYETEQNLIDDLIYLGEPNEYLNHFNGSEFIQKLLNSRNSNEKSEIRQNATSTSTSTSNNTIVKKNEINKSKNLNFNYNILKNIILAKKRKIVDEKLNGTEIPETHRKKIKIDKKSCDVKNKTSSNQQGSASKKENNKTVKNKLEECDLNTKKMNAKTDVSKEDIGQNEYTKRQRYSRVIMCNPLNATSNLVNKYNINECNVIILNDAPNIKEKKETKQTENHRKFEHRTSKKNKEPTNSCNSRDTQKNMKTGTVENMQAKKMINILRHKGSKPDININADRQKNTDVSGNINKSVFTNKSYNRSENISMKSKVCDFTGEVIHYKESHSKRAKISSEVSLAGAKNLTVKSMHRKRSNKTLKRLKNAEPNKCIFCKINNIFNPQKNDNNIGTRIGEYQYKCQSSEITYFNKRKLQKHIREAHPTYDSVKGTYSPFLIHTKLCNAYMCSICNFVGTDYSTLKYHVQNIHSRKDEKINDVWTIIRIHLDQNVFENNEKMLIFHKEPAECMPSPWLAQNVAKEFVANKLPVKSLDTIRKETSLKQKPASQEINPIKNSPLANNELRLEHVNDFKVPESKTKAPTVLNDVSKSRTKEPTVTQKVPESTTKAPTVAQKVTKLKVPNVSHEITESRTKKPTGSQKVPGSKIKAQTVSQEVPKSKIKTQTVSHELPESEKKTQSATYHSNNSVQETRIRIKPTSSFCKESTHVSCKYSNFKLIETLETQSFNQQKYTDVILPSGYQFVNSKEQLGVNRMRINIENKAFTEVVTDEKKYYYESVKMLPAQKMKTDNAYAKMLSMCRTVNLFKCLNRKCFVTYKKVTEFQKHMHMHFERYAEQKQFPELCANKLRKKMTDQFQMCIQCFRKFNNEISLTNHITEKYAHCLFQCKLCFYRAREASHVWVHQVLMHKITSPSILQLKYHKRNLEKLLVVNYKKFILRYVCPLDDCLFSCYLSKELSNHFLIQHPEIKRYRCIYCDREGEKQHRAEPALLIEHLKKHGLNKFQCIYCLFGACCIDQMLCHLSMEHFEYDSQCLKRSVKHDSTDSSIIDNLKMIVIRKHVAKDSIQVETIVTPYYKQEDICLEDPVTIKSEIVEFAENHQTPIVLENEETIGLETSQLLASENHIEPYAPNGFKNEAIEINDRGDQVYFSENYIVKEDDGIDFVQNELVEDKYGNFSVENINYTVYANSIIKSEEKNDSKIVQDKDNIGFNSSSIDAALTIKSEDEDHNIINSINHGDATVDIEHNSVCANVNATDEIEDYNSTNTTSHDNDVDIEHHSNTVNTNNTIEDKERYDSYVIIDVDEDICIGFNSSSLHALSTIENEDSNDSTLINHGDKNVYFVHNSVNVTDDIENYNNTIQIPDGNIVDIAHHNNTVNANDTIKGEDNNVSNALNRSSIYDILIGENEDPNDSNLINHGDNNVYFVHNSVNSDVNATYKVENYNNTVKFLDGNVVDIEHHSGTVNVHGTVEDEVRYGSDIIQDNNFSTRFNGIQITDVWSVENEQQNIINIHNIDNDNNSNVNATNTTGDKNNYDSFINQAFNVWPAGSKHQNNTNKSSFVDDIEHYQRNVDFNNDTIEDEYRNNVYITSDNNYIEHNQRNVNSNDTVQNEDHNNVYIISDDEEVDIEHYQRNVNSNNDTAENEDRNSIYIISDDEEVDIEHNQRNINPNNDTIEDEDRNIVFIISDDEEVDIEYNSNNINANDIIESEDQNILFNSLNKDKINIEHNSVNANVNVIVGNRDHNNSNTIQSSSRIDINHSIQGYDHNTVNDGINLTPVTRHNNNDHDESSNINNGFNGNQNIAINGNKDGPQQLFEIMKLRNLDVANSNNTDRRVNIRRSKRNNSEVKLYSLDNIKDIPKLLILENEARCSLCNYTTIVRSKIVSHLNTSHREENKTATGEPSDQLPSSNANSISEKDEVALMHFKSVEMHPSECTQILPSFVDKRRRFKCSYCNHRAANAKSLVAHLKTRHPQYSYYICPHCSERALSEKAILLNCVEFHLSHHAYNLYKCQYCNFCHFNKNSIKKHEKFGHPKTQDSEQSNMVIKIRELNHEQMAVDNEETPDNSIYEWKCKICVAGVKYTKNDMLLHASLFHNSLGMYKCKMCNFSLNKDDKIAIKAHYNAKHPNSKIIYYQIYEKVAEEENHFEQVKLIHAMVNQKLLNPKPEPFDDQYN